MDVGYIKSTMVERLFFFFFPYSTASFPFLSTSNKSRRGKGFFFIPFSMCVICEGYVWTRGIWFCIYIYIYDDDDDDTPFILDVPEQRDIEIIMAVKESFFMNFFFVALKILKDGEANGLFEKNFFIDL